MGFADPLLDDGIATQLRCLPLFVSDLNFSRRFHRAFRIDDTKPGYLASGFALARNSRFECLNVVILVLHDRAGVILDPRMRPGRCVDDLPQIEEPDWQSCFHSADSTY